MANGTRGVSRNENRLVRVRTVDRSIPPALTRGEQWLRNRAANRTEQSRIVIARGKNAKWLPQNSIAPTRKRPRRTLAEWGVGVGTGGAGSGFRV